MKAKVFVFLLAGVAGFGALDSRAQTTPDQAAPPPLDPAKIAEYQARFQHGYDLEQAGKLEDARAIYDGILAEQPEAKRSLLEAGRVSLELSEPDKADAYLEKLHALVPDFPEAYELLIQANQALKKDIKVERLVREYRALRDSGRVEGFDQSSDHFLRERISLDKGEEIDVLQFFDYTQPPSYSALEADYYDATHNLKRVLLLRYDPDATKALRQKNPAGSNATFFFIAEPIYSGGKTTRVDVYQEILIVPEYGKARNTMLGDLARTPKPIYTQATDGAQGAASTPAPASH